MKRNEKRGVTLQEDKTWRERKRRKKRGERTPCKSRQQQNRDLYRLQLLSFRVIHDEMRIKTHQLTHSLRDGKPGGEREKEGNRRTNERRGRKSVIHSQRFHDWFCHWFPRREELHAETRIYTFSFWRQKQVANPSGNRKKTVRDPLTRRVVRQNERLKDEGWEEDVWSNNRTFRTELIVLVGHHGLPDDSLFSECNVCLFSFFCCPHDSLCQFTSILHKQRTLGNKYATEASLHSMIYLTSKITKMIWPFSSEETGKETVRKERERDSLSLKYILTAGFEGRFFLKKRDLCRDTHSFGIRFKRVIPETCAWDAILIEEERRGIQNSRIRDDGDDIEDGCGILLPFRSSSIWKTSLVVIFLHFSSFLVVVTDISNSRQAINTLLRDDKNDPRAETTWLRHSHKLSSTFQRSI